MPTEAPPHPLERPALQPTAAAELLVVAVREAVAVYQVAGSARCLLAEDLHRRSRQSSGGGERPRW